MKLSRKIISTLMIPVLLTSCVAHTHVVGSGGEGNGKPGQFDVKRKQVYLFYGLVPIKGNKTTKEMAEGHENYTIRTTTSAGDVAISSLVTAIPIVGLFLGLTTRTERVSFGE